MKKAPFFAAAAVLLSLAACENKPEEVSGTAPDPQAEALKNAPKVELPPSIEASVSMRCKDNSVVFADFYQGAKMVLIKETKDGPGTLLKAPEAGQPFVADGGYKVTGTSKNATIEVPGKGSRACHG
ncbi:putative lipoprotein NlpE involved in copper resistance [Sphingomonas kyeonggiensis]|uniref:Putative lipoprotein NlpE involved in copper resistance n=1 Tax=Sphingomonas kyeonggiensis TaxID=1268553 RepID=A0A7W7K5C7_9SPHN|nr:hypothetical protein [Sphingomonas kyeonggiensis]MBB4841359.1 putative lipoprotein NlpE involved in copper resistance [Sphingomonas kyeonggiensis]